MSMERPVTGISADSAISEEADIPGTNQATSNEDDFSGSSRLPQPGSRPVTSLSSVGPSSRPRTVAGPMRPVTSRGRVSRPGTAVLPDWMFSEEEAGGGQGEARPRTGHPRHTVSLL